MGKKQGAKKQKVETPAKSKKAAPVKPVPSDSESDSSSEEEEVQMKPQQKKAVKAAESSSEEESSEEETAVPQQNAQKKSAVKRPLEKNDDSSSEEDSDEEEPPAKKGTPQKAVAQTKAAPAAESDDDSSEEDEEEAAPAKKVQQMKQVGVKKKQVSNTQADSDDDDESSEEDSSEEEDESSEEESKPAKKSSPVGKAVQKKDAKAVNGKKVAQKEDTSDEDDSDDDDDEEEEDDDDEEEETVKVPETNKRKKEKGKKEPPVKKQKLDASAVNGDAANITLFVGNLNKSTTEEEVSEFFSENNVSVAEVRKPPNKNNAFVDLEDAGDLDSALALSGSTLKNNTITVEKAKPRVQKDQQNQSFGSPRDRAQGDNDKDSRTLFVKNLPEDATAESLREIFDTASDIRIPQRDGYHKGFGFIEFSDAETMEAAMSEKQGAELSGSSLFLDYMGSKSSFKKQRGGPGGGRGGDRRGRGNFRDGGDRRQNSGARGESKVLFVKNLSYDTDESSLKSVFEGAVSARIPTFPDSGKPKGFAFVDFKSAEAAAEAYDSMNGESIDGRRVTLDFAADKGSGGGGFGGGFSPRGRGGRGGGRGFGGRGRGGDRGRGRGGGRGFNKARGGIVQSEGKRMTFDDSD